MACSRADWVDLMLQRLDELPERDRFRRVLLARGAGSEGARVECEGVREVVVVRVRLLPRGSVFFVGSSFRPLLVME